MLLHGLSLEVLRVICDKISLGDLCRLFATNDQTICNLLVSASVVPNVTFDNWQDTPHCAILQRYLKKHESVLEFDTVYLTEAQVADVLLSTPRPSLVSLSLHGAISSPSKLSLLELSHQETFASLFPSLKTLKFLGIATLYNPRPRNAFLQRFCAKLPERLETLDLSSRSAWPTLQALPKSLTSLTVLNPLAIEEYGRQRRPNAFGAPYVTSAPAYDMLCSLHNVLPKLVSVTLQTPRVSTFENAAPAPAVESVSDLLPSLRQLSVRPSGECVEELSLIVAALPSMQELTLLADFAAGFNSRKLDFKPSFTLPPSLTKITVNGGNTPTSPSLLLNEHFFNAWPPTLETATLNHITATFGAKTVIPHALGAGGIPPFFGGGTAGRGVGGAGFFQAPDPQTAPSVDIHQEKTWDPSVPWTSVLPATLRRLVLTHTDFDLRCLPEMLERLQVSDSAEANPSVAAGDRLLPRDAQFPATLTHLQIPLITLTPADIKHLPSSLAYLQCRLSDNWTQHDLKLLLQVQCPLAHFDSPSILDFTWNDKEKALAREFMPRAILEALEIDFSFSKLIIEWLGKDLYLRCARLNWKIGAPHIASALIDGSHTFEEVPLDMPASELFSFPAHAPSTSNTGWFGTVAPQPFTARFNADGSIVTANTFDPFLKTPPSRGFAHPDLAMSPSTLFADLRYMPNGEIGEMSESAIAAHLALCPNLEVFKAVLEGSSSHPLAFAYPGHSKLALLSNLTTLQLEGANFLRVPFTSFPRSLTSLVSHERNKFPNKLPFGEYQNVSALPRGLTRLEVPTILLGVQALASWPTGLTSLIFCPFEWDDVHVRSLQRHLPLQRLHLDDRIFYTGELEVEDRTSLSSLSCSSSMDVDKCLATASKSSKKKMRELPIFALHSLLSLVSRELAPATFFNIEVRKKFTTLVSPQIETIELMNVATTFNSQSRSLLWESSFNSLLLFNDYIDYVAKCDIMAESPALAAQLPVRPNASPFAAFNITFTAAELSKYVYLTSFKLSTHPLTLEDVALLPRTLAELSIVMMPSAQLQLRMDFKPFPRHLTSLNIISSAKLTLNREDMDGVPKTLKVLYARALRFLPDDISSWKSLPLLTRLGFDGHATWTDRDISTLGSIMAGGTFELLEVWNACISGALLPPSTMEISAYSLVRDTNKALSSKYYCHWKHLAAPFAPLPNALRTLDLSAARLSIFGRYAFTFPSSLTSLTLRLERQLIAQELMALPQSLRVLRLLFDRTPAVPITLDPNFWACLPADLEELVVDHILSHWLSGQSPASLPCVLSATLHDTPIFNIENPQPTGMTTMSWGDSEFYPSSVDSIPYLASSHLRTLILPSHVLKEECLRAFGDSLEKLHVYQLENVENWMRALGRDIELVHASADTFNLARQRSADIFRTTPLSSQTNLATPGGGYFVAAAALPVPPTLDPSLFNIRDNSVIYTHAVPELNATVPRKPYYWV